MEGVSNLFILCVYDIFVLSILIWTTVRDITEMSMVYYLETIIDIHKSPFDDQMVVLFFYWDDLDLDLNLHFQEILTICIL